MPLPDAVHTVDTADAVTIEGDPHVYLFHFRQDSVIQIIAGSEEQARESLDLYLQKQKGSMRRAAEYRCYGTCPLDKVFVLDLNMHLKGRV